MKKITVLLFAVLLTIGSTGCAIRTSGGTGWELYVGFRAQQISKEPAEVEIESTVVDKVVDLFTKPDKTSDE